MPHARDRYSALLSNMIADATAFTPQAICSAAWSLRTADIPLPAEATDIRPRAPQEAPSRIPRTAMQRIKLRTMEELPEEKTNLAELSLVCPEKPDSISLGTKAALDFGSRRAAADYRECRRKASLRMPSYCAQVYALSDWTDSLGDRTCINL